MARPLEPQGNLITMHATPSQPEQDAAVQEMLDALEQRSIEGHEIIGGYPAAIEIIGGHLVIADADENSEVELEHMPLEEALRRFRKAKAGVKNGEYEDISEAMHEEEL